MTSSTRICRKAEPPPRAPLIKSIMLLAYRLVRNQDSILKACRYLVKNTNAEYGQACKPLRARPEGHICHVAKPC
jgi:hypothetical protein